MNDKIIPEEKLLNLIRGQKKQDKIDKRNNAFAYFKKFQSKNQIFTLIQKYLLRLDLRKIISIIFIISCLYLVIALIYPFFGLGKIRMPKITEEKINEPKESSRQDIKPYEFYAQAISGRQIFSSSVGQQTGAVGGNVNIDITKDINLVGIISGENPQAAIEDKKNQKTYYVTKGQFIGEFQVEDIQEGKIIINYREQRFELYL